MPISHYIAISLDIVFTYTLSRKTPTGFFHLVSHSCLKLS